MFHPCPFFRHEVGAPALVVGFAQATPGLLPHPNSHPHKLTHPIPPSAPVTHSSPHGHAPPIPPPAHTRTRDSAGPLEGGQPSSPYPNPDTSPKTPHRKRRAQTYMAHEALAEEQRSKKLVQRLLQPLLEHSREEQARAVGKGGLGGGEGDGARPAHQG